MLSNKFIKFGDKSLVLRSRYGSGKTTFMQQVIKKHKPDQVLFVTYRQTLARGSIKKSLQTFGVQELA